MLKYFWLYYNYFLVKWGFRKVLPAYFINRIEVADCGEELVLYQNVRVRKRVAVMLENAQRALPPHFELKIESGFRSDTAQGILQWKYSDPAMLSCESGHSTGGAVDVSLCYCGKIADCGCRYRSFTPATPTWSKELNKLQQRYRSILFNAMTQAGFVNNPAEWWHYSFGDKMYSAYKFEKRCFYGKGHIPCQPDLFATE